MARPKKNLAGEIPSTPEVQETPKRRGRPPKNAGAAQTPKETPKPATPPSTKDSPGADIFITASEELGGEITAIRETMSSLQDAMKKSTASLESSLKAVFKEAGRMSKELASAGNAEEIATLQKELAASEKLVANESVRTEKAVSAALKTYQKEILEVVKEASDNVKNDDDIEKPWKKFILDLFKTLTVEVKELPFPGEE